MTNIQRMNKFINMIFDDKFNDENVNISVIIRLLNDFKYIQMCAICKYSEALCLI